MSSPPPDLKKMFKDLRNPDSNGLAKLLEYKERNAVKILINGCGYCFCSKNGDSPIVCDKCHQRFCCEECHQDALEAESFFTGSGHEPNSVVSCCRKPGCEKPDLIVSECCRKVKYCSKKCEFLDQQRHKENCALFKRERPKETDQSEKKCQNPKCLNNNTKQAAAASAASQKLQRCSICKSAFYCGRECQKQDWENHKKSCRPQQDIRSAFPHHEYISKEVIDWPHHLLMFDPCSAQFDVKPINHILRIFYSDCVLTSGEQKLAIALGRAFLMTCLSGKCTAEESDLFLFLETEAYDDDYGKFFAEFARLFLCSLCAAPGTYGTRHKFITGTLAENYPFYICKEGPAPYYGKVGDLDISLVNTQGVVPGRASGIEQFERMFKAGRWVRRIEENMWDVEVDVAPSALWNTSRKLPRAAYKTSMDAINEILEVLCPRIPQVYICTKTTMSNIDEQRGKRTLLDTLTPQNSFPREIFILNVLIRLMLELLTKESSVPMDDKVKALRLQMVTQLQKLDIISLYPDFQQLIQGNEKVYRVWKDQKGIFDAFKLGIELFNQGIMLLMNLVKSSKMQGHLNTDDLVFGSKKWDEYDHDYKKW